VLDCLPGCGSARWVGWWGACGAGGVCCVVGVGLLLLFFLGGGKSALGWREVGFGVEG
jgi:hypothetical protein